MNHFKKHLSIILVLVLLLSMTCTGCQTKLGQGLRDFFVNIFGRSKSPAYTTEVNLPDRPFILDPGEEATESLPVFLSRPDVPVERLILDPVLEDQVLSATSLEEIVRSKTQVDNLKRLKNELQLLTSIMDTDQSTPDSVKISARNLSMKIESLLSGGMIPLDTIKPSTGFAGTWTKEDVVLLRWIPQMDWIPEGGYNLYRVLGGSTELLAEGMGTEQEINKLVALRKEYSEYIKPLFDNTKITAAVLMEAGVRDLEEFNRFAFTIGNPVLSSYRFSGADDFSLMQNSTFMVKATLDARIPYGEQTVASSVTTVSNRYILPVSLSLMNTSSLAQVRGPVVEAVSPILDRASLVGQVIESRNDILTKANIDAEFANDAGFGYADDLKGKTIEKNTLIEYILVPQKPVLTTVNLTVLSSGTRPDGTFSIKVPYGVEIPLNAPAVLEGYGADNLVYLRWTPPQSEQENSIVSGYMIERKKNKENQFKQLNEVPVAISYTRDEYGIFYEMPYFHLDEDMINGDTAVYRVRALDLFGRLSEYSHELNVTVYKVTPPNTPNLDQPSLSTGNLNRVGEYVRETADLNKGKTGVILPIYRTSNDTKLFVVYRSLALGTNSFASPVEIARINVQEMKSGTASRSVVKYNNNRVLMNPASATDVDTVYFDSDVLPGYYYRYWVAAVDDVGNESPWSSGRVVSYPTDEPPVAPSSAQASMERNTLPNSSLDVPGFFMERFDGTSDSTPPAKSDFAFKADTLQISVGVSISEVVRKNPELVPWELSSIYSNLPDERDVHDIIVLGDNDILAGSVARVSWYHYSGDGLASYHVYRTYADNRTIEDLAQMSRSELLESFFWINVGKNLQQNLLMDPVDQQTGRLYLYLVFLVPEESESASDDIFTGGFNIFLPGGWVNLSWTAPDDPQLGYYRVYKSEVPFFSEGQDEGSLQWTMVSDNVKFTGYSEKVDQTFAHYYYFKVTSVSIWGQESTVGAVTKIRVPATSPPQTPSMLLPFAQKGQVEIQWVGVAHASKYILYRRKLPRVLEEDIVQLQGLSPDFFKKMLTTQTLNDAYFSDRLVKFQGMFVIPSAVEATTITPTTTIPIISKFNTVQLVSKQSMLTSISQIRTVEKIDIYKNIVDKYGILAVAPYGQLDLDMAKLVTWDTVTEITIPQGSASTGIFSHTDKNVEFGETYLYTVQAVNDDNLYSGRPDPVTVSPRKATPFPPVTNVRGEVDNDAGKPRVTWDSAKEPNLSWKESREFIAGYIVYKSKTENGDYYQASPLITDTTYVDRTADVHSANWYKVKVLDTGGFLSDFSAPVKVQKAAAFLIPSFKIIIPSLRPGITTGSTPLGGEGEVIPAATLSQTLIPIVPITPIVPIIPQVPNTLTINGFTITGLSAETVNNMRGDGILVIGEKYQVPVTLTFRSRQGTVVTSGWVDLKEPVTFGETGVHFNDLSISTDKAGAFVTGYVKNPGEGNLIGDLYALTFNQAEMSSAGIVKLGAVPGFHYDNLIVRGATLGTLNLGGVTQQAQTGSSTNLTVAPVLVYGSSFITLITGQVETNLGMETLDNKGLRLSFGMIGFDQQGRMSGPMALQETQLVRTVVPAGLGIRVTAATLVYKDGLPDTSVSSINGKVLLPFETFADTLPVTFDPNMFVKTYSDKIVLSTDFSLHNTIVASTTSNLNLSATQKDIVDRGMFYLANRIQATSLKVLPMDILVQEKLSTVPFSVTSWDGKGFVVQDTTMTPALIGNSNEEIGVTPGKVALDLSKLAGYTGQAPADTQDPGWMGIVVKNGRVGLPPAFIKTESDTRVMFTLTPGEFLYDRNGVFYQNQAYSQEGIPVNFGDKLGGFRDAIVNLIYLDIYGNKPNLEIHGEVGIPLFGYQRAKIRLYTSDELGKLVCSVAETDKFDPSGTGEVFIKILGGHLQEDGLHMDGTIDLMFQDKLVQQDMQFNELVVPSDMDKMTATGNAGEVYGRALFNKPYRIRFHDFDMDVRALTLDSVKMNLQLQLLQPMLVTGFKRDMRLGGITVPFTTDQVPFYTTTLTMWGGMQLSDNLSMDNNEDFDRIAISGVFTAPNIRYEESKSKVDMDFEDFAQVKTVAVPVLSEGDDGIIEYNTDHIELLFNTAASMIPSTSIEANARMGFDKVMGRYFFALAIYYNDPTGGIKFGYATMNNITGVFGYNLDLAYNDETGFDIPGGKQGLFNAIDDLEVNRTPGGNYFFAATAWIFLGYEVGGTNLKLGELRNVYLVVEKGPNVEIGGDYYGPASVQSLMSGTNLKYMGTARLGYYHKDRHLKFSLSLYDLGMYGCTINGDMGFDMSPKLWEVRFGYPEMLVAKYSGFTGGMGLVLRYSDQPNDSYIKARMFFGYDTGDITIWPVYFRAYLYVGGEGEYYFDSGDIVLLVWLDGGLEGGIKVAGKKFKIIHMTVGAEAKLTRSTGDWNLSGNVRIHYHLNLLLKTVSGSKNWHVSKSF